MIQLATPWFPGKCVGWNSAGGGLARAVVGMGVPVEYLYPGLTREAVDIGAPVGYLYPGHVYLGAGGQESWGKTVRRW